jgi:hypothetical protein
MQQCFQDAMAIVRKYGKPDLFITITCNPNWEEITKLLSKTKQSAQDRPDIVARAFRLKLKRITNDISNGHVFGVPAAHIYVIEFQKRGFYKKVKLYNRAIANAR